MENKDQVFNLDMFVLNLSVLFLLMIKNASEIKFPSNSLFISPISNKKKKKKTHLVRACYISMYILKSSHLTDDGNRGSGHFSDLLTLLA